MEASKKICRTCLADGKTMFSLFSTSDATISSLADMLKSFVPIEVDPEDNLPDFICGPCINTLTVSYNFKNQCEHSDRLLRNCTDVKIEDESIESDESIDTNKSSSPVSQIYMCELCEKNFSKLKFLKCHMKKHMMHECSNCGQKFETYKKFTEHKASHKLKCERCPLESCTCRLTEQPEYICLISDEEMKVKFKPPRVIDQQLDELTEETVEAEIFTCSNCSHEFINEDELHAHEKVHKEEHECTDCAFKCTTYDDLVAHNKENHNRFNCKTCTKQFATSNGLSGHMRHHIYLVKGKPSFLYKCTINDCGRTFLSLDYLRRHKPSHETAKRTYLCNLCGKVYTSNNSYYYHKKMHRNERPYICSYCGNSYKLICHLKNHMWIHTGERQHECKTCGKRFSRRLVLKKHIATNCGSKKRRKVAVVPIKESAD